MFYKTISLVFLVGFFSANAQQNDSIIKIDSTSTQLKFNYKQLIIPGVLIGYGAIGIGNDQLLSFNHQIKSEVTEDIDEKITIDDFSQYAPAASVYALNAFGVKGKNNMRDRSVIFVTSYVIMASTVLGLKSIIHEERPDGSSDNSFPSGHTATAFAGAEFLWQEYKDKSIWYGIAGYAVATGTGLFRIYNNRHWLTDVAAGAGIGILSTKLAYWMNPYISKKLFKSSSESKSTSMIAPFYNGQQYGLSFVKAF
ncbi:PAP2 superfamily protein [Flavobacterium chryseum]|uniref:phosphatase PAP2 family protein n=1 Tax=Flavobacterium sp. P3160 TaxID=2512113 RepID=UPI00105EB1F1|nr:phosphatase PAP2 family protein [Flavobacterium sp. P3160]TDO69946.1 PAP2 superfamily protein [Flavobacterium sp. P3160]